MGLGFGCPNKEDCCGIIIKALVHWKMNTMLFSDKKQSSR